MAARRTFFGGTGGGGAAGPAAVEVYADATARDAAMPDPADGALAFVDDELQVYAADTWTVLNPGDVVTSVAGRTGVVVLTKSDVGLSNVDNTTDAGKPISTATQTALDLKAALASPTFTGTPAAPTAAPGTNTTQIATTAFVAAASGDGGGLVYRGEWVVTDPYVVNDVVVHNGISYVATADSSGVSDFLTPETARTFETGLGGWTDFGGTPLVRITTEQHSGTYCIKNVANWGADTPAIAVSANTSYIATVWVKAPYAPSGIRLQIDIIGGTTGTPVYINNAGWTQLSRTFNTGAATSIKFRVSTLDYWGSVEWYIDDASLLPAEAAPSPADWDALVEIPEPEPVLAPGTLVFKGLRNGGNSYDPDTDRLVPFDVVHLDTQTAYVASPSFRLTPEVAGWYEVAGAMSFAANGTGYRSVFFKFNGSAALGGRITVPAIAGVAMCVPAPTMCLQFNGTTDYIEMFCYHTAGVTLSHDTSACYPYMTAKYVGV